jgi:tRNA G18 (ribose-2'-O)-methylase SpoU
VNEFSLCYVTGIFRMPNLEKNDPAVKPLPITLICDNIRDPGNLGSVLRVAAALPVEKVILLTGR